jgi:hypothetical protein
MEFKQVNFYQLKPNTKYIITDLNGAFYSTGYFCVYVKGGKDVAHFKDVVCNIPIKRHCGYVTFSYEIGRKYYTIVSKKKDIQNAMESRAINLIIQNILGDTAFNYLNI